MELISVTPEPEDNNSHRDSDESDFRRNKVHPVNVSKQSKELSASQTENEGQGRVFMCVSFRT